MVAPTCVADFEELARQRLPASEFEILASFADGNETLRRTPHAYDALAVRTRVLPGVDSADTSVTVLGQRLEVPFMLAPAGFHTRAHPDGELATARAASKAGTLMVLATNSGHPVAEVAAASHGPKWLQTYFYRDRQRTLELAEQAEALGFEGLCMTLDGHWPVKRQLGVKGNRRGGQTIDGDRSPLRVMGDPAATWSDPKATWADVAWLKAHTKLPVICKGIMTAEDAELGVTHGADALIVSNHGARLGCTLASIEALPEVVAAVGGRAEIFLDGGIRRGADVVRALALGARAVLIGRPLFWGLAYNGEHGLLDLLDLLREELEMVMMLSGCPTIGAIDQNVVVRSPPLVDPRTDMR